MLHSDKATLPVTASAGAGGYDLSAAGDYTISPGCLTFAALDCAVEIPVRFVAPVLPRAGLVLCCSVEPVTGITDSEYRGTICALLPDYGSERYEVRAGDGRAQLVIVPCLSRLFQCVPALTRPSMSRQGIGSTGVRSMSDCVERQPPSSESLGMSRGTESVRSHRRSVQGASSQGFHSRICILDGAPQSSQFLSDPRIIVLFVSTVGSWAIFRGFVRVGLGGSRDCGCRMRVHLCASNFYLICLSLRLQLKPVGEMLHAAFLYLSSVV